MKLNQKVVIVTGANGGLGNTVTKAFLDAGARVTGVSRAIKDADFYHANFSAMPATLATHADAQQLVEQVLHRFERVDALVHLVGGFAGGSSIARCIAVRIMRIILRRDVFSPPISF